ncbi:Restriction endonuclease [Enhygromyxa salina]|uniref:Restriction endonuclease n=1 Tax=Enhygromyxa salina TaxID=215803 RepID=A0A2S9XPE6_9BACT|nr:restriction endonuclease [Enhygromyxa salina]PRP94725.1 Restriction endonuclease [Enhygromyxa salina]
MTELHIEARAKSLLESLASGDLLQRQTYLADIADFGHQAIPVLLDQPVDSILETALREIIRKLTVADRERACTHLVRALRRDRDSRARLLALTLLGELLPDLSGFVDKSIEIALDEGEPTELRARALLTLQAARLSKSNVRDLGKLLNITTVGPDSPVQLRDAAFQCLATHVDHLAVDTTMKQLDLLLACPDPQVRAHAVRLLGEVGDIDAIERMCMLSSTRDESDQTQAAITRILRRPINLFSLRWEHFEHFVGYLLRKMGHEDVEVTRTVRDEGIDVISYRERQDLKGPTRERWVVQCKRWTKNKVEERHLVELVQRSRDADAKHALLITTSSFTPSALEYGKQHENAIELVCGEELLVILDKEFEPGRYTIRARD